MNRCDRHPEREEISAWLDGELGPIRRSAVARHLDRCEVCASLVGAYRKRDNALRMVFGLAPVVDRDGSPIASRHSAWIGTRRWAPAAVLLIVIVATGLAGLWTSRALRGPASLQAVADGAIEAYRNVPWSTPAPTAPVAASAADLTGWASKALGHRVRIPDLADGGYRLVGRWVQHGDGGPRIVTVAFEDATGGRVLCYFSRRNATDESALRYRDAGNVGAVFRIDEGVGYAVAGTVGRRELTRIAELAYPADREEESTGE